MLTQEAKILWLKNFSLVVLKISWNIIKKEFKKLIQFVNLNSFFSFAIYLLYFLILKTFPYKKTLIIGLGLLGGSIAKAFKKYDISQNIYAFDIDIDALDLAKEQKIIDNTTLLDDDLKDFRMLSIQSTFEKIKDLIDKNKKVICNLIDRDGRINTEIKSVYSDYENEKYTLILKHDERIELQDNYLYNIIYNIQKDNYSLESGEEFFEKIPVKNED